jgi:trehalose synthase
MKVPAASLDEYRAVIGDRHVDELFRFGERLRGMKVQHINSTRLGGGVSEILTRMVPLMVEVGLAATWDVINGDDEFFRVTKAFHNAIQGMEVELTASDFDAYLRTNRRNGEKLDLYGDAVVIHDPQPAALIDKRKRTQLCLWRCHIDASNPTSRVWRFLEQFVRRFDASIFSAPVFARPLPIPRFMVAPAIDPLSEKNRVLTDEQVNGVCERFGIDRKRPVLTQISRFDRFKDPVGVVRMYQLVKEAIDCQLVLAGGSATDDPEGAAVLAEVEEAAGGDPDIKLLLLPPTANFEINALQRASTIVVQKSTREGFGLTVTEALWKGKPVIGGATGGIPMQILDGGNGYLVSSPEGAAFRARYLLTHPDLCAEMGRRGIEHVRQNFLLTRNLRDYLLMLLLMRDPKVRRIVL